MLSVVIPVYRNEDSLIELLADLGTIDDRTEEPLEVVFVVDGSPDRSFEVLRAALPQQPYRSRLALLTRNFGAFPAIRAGLDLAGGDRYAVMTADLQEPPELVLEMDSVLRSGAADVVVAVRGDRSDPLIARTLSRIYWALYRRFVVREIPPGGVDVFGCNRPFRDQLLRLDERHSSLIGQIFWLGYRRATVSYARRPRKHGKSAWTVGKKVEYLMDSVFAFTDLPLRLLVRLGGLVAALAGIFGLVVAILRLTGAITVPGYAAVVILVVFLGALNLFGLGVVGSYAWRTYENTKDRPLHIVLEYLDFGPSPSNDE